MTPPGPLTDDEARAVAVFPLPNAVLLPGSALALHLFEPRYRALARACLDAGPRVMAIATLLPGYESDYHGRPPIARIAGVGRIVAHHERTEGTFDILLLGIARVTLDEIEDRSVEFRRARVTPFVEPDETPALVRAVDALVALARHVPVPPRLMPVPPSEIEGPAARRIDLLADRHFPTDESGTRRAILEAVDPHERARILDAALSLRVLAAARPSGAPN